MQIDQLTLNLLVCLLAAVLAVPGARKLGIGSVPGYLLGGIVAGPWGLALIRDADQIGVINNIGLLALLFVIGLELKLKMLIRLYRNISVVGSTQILLTALVIFVLAMLLQRAWYESLFVAVTLSFSSHTVFTQLADERNLLNTNGSQVAYSILLFQAMIFIPVLLAMPLLGYGNPVVERADWWEVLAALAVVVLVLASGHYILKWGYRYVLSLRYPEIFMAFTILMILTVVSLLQWVGVSAAIGAFICGVLLADSEYFRKIDNDIEPYRGLAVGLFFMAIGLALDFGMLLQRPSEIVGLIISLVFLKAAVMYGVSKIAKIPFVERPLTAVLMAQSGEFGFILLGVGATHHVIPEKIEAMLMLVVALSMLSTPLLLILLERYLPGWLTSGLLAEPETDVSASTGGPSVIIAGFGRYGQVVARLLKSAAVDVTVIDHDPLHLASVRDLGFKVLYGDARRSGLLAAAGADAADALVIALDDREHTLELAMIAQKNYPSLGIAARAWDRNHYTQLVDSGVTLVQREVFESAVLTGEDVLTMLGKNIEEVERTSEAFRDHDVRLLRSNMRTENYSDEDRIDEDELSVASAMPRQGRARDDLLRVIEQDARQQALERTVDEEEPASPEANSKLSKGEDDYG